MQHRGLARICHDFRVTTGRDLALAADIDREIVWGGWPICPEHGRHPLDPRVDDNGVAMWFCPRGKALARVGDLPGGDERSDR